MRNLINYADYLYREEVPEEESMEYLCGILHRTLEHFKGRRIEDPQIEGNLAGIEEAYNQMRSRLDSLK